MAQPTPYDRQFSFQDFQAQEPTTPLPGDEVDGELNAVKLTIDQTLVNLAKIQRDDGALKNGIVTQDALSDSLSIGFTYRGTWGSGVNYLISDGASVGSIFYKAKSSHLSSGANQPPNATFWDPIADFTPLAIGVDSVSTAALQNLAVTTAKIADANVTTAKIADANVTTAKIADANVTTAKIADANVTTAKIADANVTAAKLAPYLLAASGSLNMGLAAAVAGNALTITLTDAAGATPSAASPVYLSFRSATAASGAAVTRAVTAATSLVISSGSTLGFTSGAASRLWLVAFDDAGTVRLGAVNCRNGLAIMPLPRRGIKSSTAEGGAGAADSAHVIYTGTAVAAKAYTVLGCLEWAAGLTTAGTWDTGPTLTEISDSGGKLPGDVICPVVTQYTTFQSGSTNMAGGNDTVPQITDGTEITTIALTPNNAANLLKTVATGNYAASAGSNLFAGLFRDATAAAKASAILSVPSADTPLSFVLKFAEVAGSTSSTTYRLRIGGFTGSTPTWAVNGISSARRLGGSTRVVIEAEEIVA